jgi:hypothetical protein
MASYNFTLLRKLKISEREPHTKSSCLATRVLIAVRFPVFDFCADMKDNNLQIPGFAWSLL